MCGRYAITTAPEAMRRLFGYLEQPNFPARYNVAPTQPIPIVRMVEGRRQFALVRWGLLPSWAKDPRNFTLLINARGESVCDKPAFRAAMRHRRCLIPADGFYEWKRDGAAKQPFYVTLKDGAPFAFAGIWENWMGPNGEEIETAAMVTTTASRSIAHIHDRMPVMLSPETFGVWLDCKNVDAQTAMALVAPVRDDLVQAHEVSTRVNRVTNDTPDLIEEVSESEKAAAAAPSPVAKTRRRTKPDDGQQSLF
jgi:putative SOS response-associated peptidase YedK